MSKDLVKKFSQISINGEEFLLNDARQDIELSDKYSYSVQRTIVKWTFSYISLKVPGDSLSISGTGDTVLSTLEKLKS